MKVDVFFEGFISDSLSLGNIETGLGNIISNAGINANVPDIVIRSHSNPGQWKVSCNFSGEVVSSDDQARDSLKTALDAQVSDMEFRFSTNYSFVPPEE